MKVLINAISARLGGGQTYLFNLLSHLSDNQGVEVMLLATSSFNREFPVDGIHRLDAPTWVENPLLRPFWERWVLPAMLKENGVDILFCPGGVVSTSPPPGCKVVTMFRNMIPFDQEIRRRYPLGFQRLRNWLLHRVMLRSMAQADLVIFISNYARRVIESQLKRALPRWEVIPHGIAERFRNHCDGVAPLSARYLLYVSNVDVYKAQLQVLQAFAKIAMGFSDLLLVFIGPENNRQYADRVRKAMDDYGLKDRVLMRGKVPYSSLPVLYQHAEVNIFASECENCPNILLEMMASGRPVVCSDRQPMPEFAADAVLYFDPAMPDVLAEILGKLLRDPRMQALYGERATNHSAVYSWQKSAEHTWRAISSLGGQ